MSALFREDGSHERYANGKRAYKCDHCGLVSSWTDDWVWFGSFEDVDAGASVLTFCCEEHGKGHERAKPELFTQKPTTRRVAGRSR